MFKILKKDRINKSVSRIIVAAPEIARAARPGNFVVIIPQANGERIPLTIADADTDKGTIAIIFQIVGASTKVLDAMKVGDKLAHLLGPLGVPSHIKQYGTCVIIGGGVGIAEIYPTVKALKAASNKVITIIGARCKDLLIYAQELGDQSSELRITTDDGTCGRKGFVSDELKAMIDSGMKIDYVMAVGPVPMMKVVCDVTKPHNIPTVVSLNPLMLDATGMCGVCRVSVGGQTKFACVEGPEFNGHEVDFKDLSDRLKPYKDIEKQAMGHVCKLLEQK